MTGACACGMPRAQSFSQSARHTEVTLSNLPPSRSNFPHIICLCPTYRNAHAHFCTMTRSTGSWLATALLTGALCAALTIALGTAPPPTWAQYMQAYCSPPHLTVEGVPPWGMPAARLLGVSGIIRHGERSPIFTIPGTRKEQVHCDFRGHPLQYAVQHAVSPALVEEAELRSGEWKPWQPGEPVPAAARAGLTLPSVNRTASGYVCKPGELTPRGLHQLFNLGVQLARAWTGAPGSHMAPALHVAATSYARTVLSAAGFIAGAVGVPDSGDDLWQLDPGAAPQKLAFPTVSLGMLANTSSDPALHSKRPHVCPASQRWIEQNPDVLRAYAAMSPAAEAVLAAVAQCEATDDERTASATRSTHVNDPATAAGLLPGVPLNETCPVRSIMALAAAEHAAAQWCATGRHVCRANASASEPCLDDQHAAQIMTDAVADWNTWFSGPTNRWQMAELAQRMAAQVQAIERAWASPTPVSTLQVHLLFAHDVTVQPLARALGGGAAVHGWPSYAARLLVELWQADGGGAKYVRVLYQGQDITPVLPCAEAHTRLCPMAAFVRHVEHMSCPDE